MLQIFDSNGEIVSSHQKAHSQIYPRPGQVEHNPNEIWNCVQETIEEAMRKSNLVASDIKSIGITNQRETTVVWNR